MKLADAVPIVLFVRAAKALAGLHICTPVTVPKSHVFGSKGDSYAIDKSNKGSSESATVIKQMCATI